MKNQAFNPIAPLTGNDSYMIFSFDRVTLRFGYMNPLFQQFFGSSTCQSGFGAFVNELHEEDRALLESLLRFGDDKSIEGLVLRRITFGQISYLKCNFYPILDTSQVFALAQDISDILEANNVVLKHNAQKNAILTILSHDVVGALSTASTLIDFAYGKASSQEMPKVQEILSVVQQICKSNIQMIRSFLQKEFLTSLSVPVVSVRNDIVDSLRKLVEQYKVMKTQLGVNVIFYSNQDQIFLQVDREKLIQVVNNLISNALKFTPKGGSISVSAVETDRAIELKIQDTGVGIPDHMKHDIFSKFSAARREGLHGEKPNGIGLWVIKTMVEWLGAEISFQSKEGCGTTFVVSFLKEGRPR